MHVISVRVADELFKETQSGYHTLSLSQTEYVHQAISEKNLKVHEAKRRNLLQQASLKVREESMKITQEFSAIEEDPHA
jgi:hypothetical protein